MTTINDPTAETSRAALRSLANRVRGEVRLGVHDRMLYATDASIYQHEPLGVVIPADIDDAAAAVRACWDLGLPVLPRGGGTSLAGQCVNEAVVIDVSAGCRGVRSIDRGSRTCVAEAGISVTQLNDALAGDPRGRGLFFAPDPATATHATIGGCIGNNAAGSRSVMYGRTSESVLGVDVCLADGRRVTLGAGAGERDPLALELAQRVMGVCARHERQIRERFPKTVRRNAGYGLDTILAQMDAGATARSISLAPLICGSEGTLAFTLSAELKLCPLPTEVGLAVVSFPSIDDAIGAVLPLLDLGPSAVELLDAMIMRLARENREQRPHVELLPGGTDAEAVLYIEFRESGGEHDAGSAIASKLDRVRGMFPAGRVGCYDDAPSMDRAWGLRKAGEPLLHGIAGSRKPVGFIEDAAVPPERLGEYVTRLRGIVEREGTVASYYAHASVGVLHVRPLLDLREPEDRDAMERIAIASADLAQELGGVMSGEHGDGRARGPLLERYFGSELMGAFREVKAIFDPQNRMNPGNIVEPGPIASIHAGTRLSAEVRTNAGVETYFDFSDQGGLAHAAGQCNGAGVCRKTSGGTMCPSYRATLDERHSTRGRGNALRLAITGQLGETAGAGPSWDDPATMATLDLCLSCKACKSECPSNVDVSKMKSEYLAQRVVAGGRVPLRDLFFGHIHTINRIGGVAPRLSNLGMRLARPIANALLGLHPDRSLPRYARPLHKRWGGLPDTTPRADAPTVILYADTFTTYNEPYLGVAARRVLEAFGYRVELFRGSDAARALLSVGLLPAAIKRADAETRAIVPRLTDPAQPIEGVLFLEPSCLSAVTDDWVSLKCATPEADRELLAGRSMLVEQFLADRWDDHPRRPAFTKPDGDVLLHAHCHQKALWGASSSGDLLERCFPGGVRTLDATCCGLAGSFGLARDRFDLSMRIGELGVLPIARDAGVGAVVVAPGTSCRHQVKDGAGTRAVHPVEIIAEAIEGAAS